MNASNSKIIKILSSYHLKLDRSVPDTEDFVAVKCDGGWVYEDMHKALIRREWFDDPGYLAGVFMAKVKPCHCPACMHSDNWVHELSYLRYHIDEVCAKAGIVSYKWDSKAHTVAGFFVSEVYEEAKPVFIKWKTASSHSGFVQASIAMSNWDPARECLREPIKKRLVTSPSTNSLYVALMGIRGDMFTPITYKAEQMDTEGVESLAGDCATGFARTYIFRDPIRSDFRALNRRDENRVRNNEIWWASMYEPDDVVRQLKSEQARFAADRASYKRDYVDREKLNREDQDE